MSSQSHSGTQVPRLSISAHIFSVPCTILVPLRGMFLLTPAHLYHAVICDVPTSATKIPSHPELALTTGPSHCLARACLYFCFPPTCSNCKPGLCQNELLL